MPTFRRNTLSPSSGLKCWWWESEGLYRMAGRARLTFLPPYIIPLISSIATSALKMEIVCFSETLASTDQSTRHQNTEEHHHFWNRNGHKCFLRNYFWSHRNHKLEEFSIHLKEIITLLSVTEQNIYQFLFHLKVSYITSNFNDIIILVNLHAHTKKKKNTKTLQWSIILCIISGIVTGYLVFHINLSATNELESLWSPVSVYHLTLYRYYFSIMSFLLGLTLN
jgi:hypothetical protein